MSKANPKSPAPEADLPYEEAREQLIEVVRALESGGTSLTESIELWERGEKLAASCERSLQGVRERLDAATGTDQD